MDFHEVSRIDRDDVPALLGIETRLRILQRPHQGEELAVGTLPRAQKLNHAGVGTGVVRSRGVAVGAVEQLEARAVRVDPVQTDLVAVDGLVTREHDLPVRQHRRREVVVGVEADLLNVAAVGIHDMQQEDVLFAVVGLGRVLRPPFVDQNGLSRRLPGGREDDASVG